MHRIVQNITTILYNNSRYCDEVVRVHILYIIQCIHIIINHLYLYIMYYNSIHTQTGWRIYFVFTYVYIRSTPYYTSGPVSSCELRDLRGRLSTSSPPPPPQAPIGIGRQKNRRRAAYRPVVKIHYRGNKFSENASAVTTTQRRRLKSLLLQQPLRVNEYPIDHGRRVSVFRDNVTRLHTHTYAHTHTTC